MNRIEQRMEQLKAENKKAFITYTTAGLKDMATTKRIIKTQEAAGIDVIELGIPFSDPVADGPVIQDASYKSILNGTTLTKVFDMMSEIRDEGVDVPIIMELMILLKNASDVELMDLLCLTGHLKSRKNYRRH